jgi:hypothetical protein
MREATLLAIRKSLKTPDISREFKNGRIDIVKLGDRTVGYVTFKPGFRLATDFKPYVDRSALECSHLAYIIRGRLAVRMDDGGRFELRPGDCVEINGDHDSWVVGDEPCEIVDFGDLSGMVKFFETSGGRPAGRPSEEWHVESD